MAGGITSSEVSNLINSQMQALAQQNQLAAQLQQQHGMSFGQPAWAQQDSFGEQIPGMAAAAGTYAGQLPGAGLAALGLAAGFGFAPRILDPFTQSLSIGSEAAGAGGWFKSGLAGFGRGVGAAGATFAGYAALGAAADYLAIDPFKTGAQMRGMTLGALQQAMPTMSMSSMASTASMMESLQRNGTASIPELTGLMGQGIAGGTLHTGSSTGFQQEFQKLIQETKQVALVLNSSLNEAYAAMQSIKTLGVSNVAGTAATMRGLGFASNMSPAETMAVAQGGAALAKMAGISRDTGVAGALMSTATFAHLGKSQTFGTDFGAQDLGTFQNASYRFFGSHPGQQTLAAMMDEDGSLDANAAARIASGAMSSQEIRRRGNRAIARHRDVFASHSQELVAQFTSEYGPAGFASALNETTRNSAMPGMQQQRLTGLNNEQLGQLSSMNMMGPQLKQAVLSAAKEGFEEGTQHLGLGDALKIAIGKMTAPIRDRFSQMGASVTQSVAETVDELATNFVTRPSRSEGDPLIYNAMMQAASLGQTNKVAQLRNWTTLAAPVTNSSLQVNRDHGTLLNMLPEGLFAGAEGTDPGDMFANGLRNRSGFLGNLGMATGGYAATRIGINFGLGGTHSALGWAGGEIGAAGSRVLSAFPATGSLGSVGAGTGLARGVGGLLKMTGWAAKGANFLGPVGWGYTALQTGLDVIAYESAKHGVGDFDNADAGTVGKMMMLATQTGGDAAEQVLNEDFDAKRKAGWIEIAGTSTIVESEKALIKKKASSDPHWAINASRASQTYAPLPLMAGPDHPWEVELETKEKVSRRMYDPKKAAAVYNSLKDPALLIKAAQFMGENDERATEITKILRGGGTQIGKTISLDALGASAEVIRGLMVNYGGMTMPDPSAEGEKRIDAWLAENKKSFLGYGPNGGIDYEHVNGASYDFLAENKSVINTAARELATTETYGTPSFYAALEKKVGTGIGDFTPSERQHSFELLRNKDTSAGYFNETLSAFSQAAADQQLGRLQSTVGGLKSDKRYAKHVATSAGISSAGLEEVLDNLATQDGPTAVATAGAFLEKLYTTTSAEQYATMAEVWGQSNSLSAQHLSAGAAQYAMSKGLDQFYHIDKKDRHGVVGKGNKWTEDVGWLEQATGMQAGALKGAYGVKEFFDKGTGGFDRTKIEASLARMMTGTSDDERPELARRAAQYAIDAARGDATAEKNFRGMRGVMPGMARPEKSDGDMSKMMSDFKVDVTTVATGMKTLADAMPKKSG